MTSTSFAPRAVRLTGLLLAGLCLLAVPGVAAFKTGWLGDPWSSFESATLNPGIRSTATPADLGLAFQHVTI